MVEISERIRQSVAPVPAPAAGGASDDEPITLD
jgi:hypothetical protein